MHDQPKEPVKYNKVVMLVHPFYDLIFSYYNYKKHDVRATSNITGESIFPDEYQRKFKLLLGAYGEALLEAGKDPKTCFIIVIPNFMAVLKEKYDKNLERMYSNITAKFFKRLNQFFGNRIYFTNYDKSTYSKELISQELLGMLEKWVSLESFGEFKDACVYDWRELYLKRELTKKGFEVYESRTNDKVSLNLSISNPAELNLKLIKMQRIRRKLRRKLSMSHKSPRLPV